MVDLGSSLTDMHHMNFPGVYYLTAELLDIPLQVPSGCPNRVPSTLANLLPDCLLGFLFALSVGLDLCETQKSGLPIPFIHTLDGFGKLIM